MKSVTTIINYQSMQAYNSSTQNIVKGGHPFLLLEDETATDNILYFGRIILTMFYYIALYIHCINNEHQNITMCHPFDDRFFGSYFLLS